jgi:hypothetical protein|tara:strand:- start:303 stop:407 length:105 start_codon:yes stop_codon:yes gene_type:complete
MEAVNQPPQVQDLALQQALLDMATSGLSVELLNQ